MSVEIRVATSADVVAAAAVHREAAVAGYSHIFPNSATPPTAESLEPSWMELITGPDSSTFVAESGGLVIGVVGVASDASVPSGLLLSRLYVSSDRWAAGIGGLLHDTAVGHARDAGAAELNLWVLEANMRARAMYERRGWTLVAGYTLANEPPEIVDVLYELVLG